MITIKSFVQNVSKKTGKPYGKAVVVSLTGKEVEATVFADFPGFPLVAGSQVDAEIKEGVPYNGKPQYILAVPYNQTVQAPAWATKGPAKASGAVEAAKITKKSVEETMDRKETNMEKMATFRDATLLTVAYLGNRKELMSVDEVQSTWTMFRKWLEGKMSEPFS